MKLNHLKLTVTDVSETRKFLEKHFGLRSMEGGKDESFALLFDDNGLVLTLMNVGQTTEVKYPASYHNWLQAGKQGTGKRDQSALEGRRLRCAAA